MRCYVAVVLSITLAMVAVGSEGKTNPTPADDLKAIQGRWTVTGIWWPSRKDDRLPKEARLNEVKVVLVIEGNRLTCAGKTVGTLTNSLPPGPQHKEVGWKGANRLMLLTLPDGKGFWCSYGFRDKSFQLTYPHTTACHRGSGQVIYMERSPK